MTYNEQIEEAKQKIAKINKDLKALREKKASITDAAERKTINKQINAKLEEKKSLKSHISYCASMNREGISDYCHFVLGDD